MTALERPLNMFSSSNFVLGKAIRPSVSDSRLKIGADFKSLFREMCGEASIPNGVAGVNMFQQSQEIFLELYEVAALLYEIFLT